MLFIKFSLSDNPIVSKVLQVVKDPCPQGTSVPVGETGLKTNISDAEAPWSRAELEKKMKVKKMKLFFMLDLCRNQLGQIGQRTDMRSKTGMNGRGVVGREDMKMWPQFCWRIEITGLLLSPLK